MLLTNKKIINHLTKNGQKASSEKIFLKITKNLQKKSNKKSKDIIILSLIALTPIFKIHEIKNKKLKKKNRKIKQIPYFINNKMTRISLSIKFWLLTLENKYKTIDEHLSKEIILNAQFKSETIKLKDNIQKQVLNNKRFLLFYYV